MDDQAVTACVLIIGNEILSGRTQDINLNHIAVITIDRPEVRNAVDVPTEKFADSTGGLTELRA